ncbi:uncharacterized protein LOC124544239 [Vanessa cardui]|uniref:uncharacterized protein LOC124535395 n=1 Tax=Vanessa cardui TaxID=171605 RepID=UPI001F12FD8C|nr:uncharacterized protein LOC124535395 [Vanessa cardui]XP_046974282.1 uncharacterized protein LOC124540659 [Vanessa cardui]XP_046978667.1 uncharacterized protein LOC124544239 [Vanessa cardui]
MDSLKKSLLELTETFNTRMAEFQKDLKAVSPATSPTSNINAQFLTFRTFVLSALESLQVQVELLTRQQDEFEMRSRRKIILIHGVPEEKKENTSSLVTKILSEHFKFSQFSPSDYTRCHRLGSSAGNKPRAILVRFNEASLRDKLWSSKTSLKGTGITLSEFLTKTRHEAFVLARRLFGIRQCWTKDGCIIVLDAEGSRHRVVSVSEVNAIQRPLEDTSEPSTVPASSATIPKGSKVPSYTTRPKRVVKK